MKRLTKWAVYALFTFALVTLNACQDSIKDVVGTYGYKISGEVTIDDSTRLVLPDEEGAMQVLREKDKKVCITLNTLGGKVYTTKGKYTGDSIVLEPFTRNITLSYNYVDDSALVAVEHTVTEAFRISVSGAGKVYDGTVIYSFSYEGEGLSSGLALQGQDIVCVAKQY